MLQKVTDVPKEPFARLKFNKCQMEQTVGVKVCGK